jgi:hypothetical protein
MNHQELTLQTVASPTGMLGEIWVNDSIMIAEIVFDSSESHYMVRFWPQGSANVCMVRLDQLLDLLGRAAEILPEVSPSDEAESP